jgi:polyisoprenoid-binding protein YceI
MRALVTLSAAVVLAFSTSTAFAADNYKVDPVHSSSVFRIIHAGIAPFWGRFNEPGGSFVLDEADHTKSSFTMEIKVANVATGNEKRDMHLKSPDFFNAAQYPTIAFKSTAVKPGDGKTLQVTGDLTIHGVTKSVTVPVELVGKGQFMGSPRAGIEATMTVKMSDFEIKGVPGALSDEVKVIVALEGAKAK